MPFFNTLPQQIWMACTLGVTGLALWRGGRAERTVAIWMTISSIATAAVQNTRDVAATQWADLLVDSLYLALLVWVALRSHRIWPLFAAAFQLVAVLIYFARMADFHVGARAPFVAGEVWSYLILLAVVVGVLIHGKDGRTAASPPTGSSAT